MANSIIGMTNDTNDSNDKKYITANEGGKEYSMIKKERIEKVSQFFWTLYPGDSPAAHAQRMKEYRKRREAHRKAARAPARSTKAPAIYADINKRMAAELFGIKLADGDQIQYR